MKTLQRSVRKNGNSPEATFSTGRCGLLPAPFWIIYQKAFSCFCLLGTNSNFWSTLKHPSLLRGFFLQVNGMGKWGRKEVNIHSYIFHFQLNRNFTIFFIKVEYILFISRVAQKDDQDLLSKPEHI